MSNPQNENLNTLGFVTSQLRRNLVIGFIIIILIVWYIDRSSLEKDKESYKEMLLDVKQKYDTAVKEHLETLKQENEYRKELEQRQLDIETKQKKISREINRINNE